MPKPKLKFWQIFNMSFGFLGIQYAFGLQQANMSPIYRYLGAEESQIPWLWLAGPVTGLLIQPLIGAMSDRTWHRRWGRRRPYFMVGAVLTSIALLLMPHSQHLWMAAGLLWLLDGAANVTMEPFRALIADKLPESQRSLGYSLQSLFVGLGQTLANTMPLVLAAVGVATAVTEGGNSIPDFVRISFYVGAVSILVSVGITVFTTSEIPPAPDELEALQQPGPGFLVEIKEAFAHMPATMKQLWWVKFFTWYGLPLMWQYLAIGIAHRCFHTSDPKDPGFAEGVTWANLGLAIFNVLCFAFSVLLPALSRAYPPKKVHAGALLIGGLGFLSMEMMTEAWGYMLGMGLVGIAWASIMSTPYVMLSNSVPPHRMGVYMGIFNMFIVVPQIANMVTIPFLYDWVLGSDPTHALVLAGICLVLAAVASLRLRATAAPALADT
jgi:maltose/moltooligosaccharide transporter